MLIEYWATVCEAGLTLFQPKPFKPLTTYIIVTIFFSEHLLKTKVLNLRTRGRILVQVTIYRRLLIGRDGHLDQSEAYDIS